MGSKKPHLLVIPFPAQGHAAPMLKFSHNLVKEQGIKVTFVNIQSSHAPILSHNLGQKIPLVSIPEGSESQLQSLILNINESNKDDDAQISHVIADVCFGWAFKTACKMGVKPVGFVPYGIANLAFVLHIPNFLQAGIIDDNGTPIKEETMTLSKDIPAWTPKSLVWSFHDKEFQKGLFRHFMFHVAEDMKLCSTILANSFYQLETAACNLIPNILPIGPLTDDSGNSDINMFAGDTTCLNWLDQQPSGSVIYAAFGSSVFISQEQLNELAIGFEITGRPFLWVVRSDFTKGTGVDAKLPEGFTERVAKFGKIVEWAPQEKVLAHRSIGCFFSHCGWNSTMEGVSKGVPFLCWPYAVDQFHNRDNICETWKIGLQVAPDENGVLRGEEIKCKIEKLLCDEDVKGNSIKLMEISGKSIGEGGSSFMNFNNFISQIQQQD